MRDLCFRLGETVNEYLKNARLSDLYDNDRNRKENCDALAGLSMMAYDSLHGAVKEYPAVHNNPILQGCVTLDKLLNYLQYSTQLMQNLSSFHRAICHVFNGLKQENFFTQEIPILETLLKQFQPHVFVSGIPPTLSGSYETQYLLASHHTVTEVAALKASDSSSSSSSTPLAISNKKLQLMKIDASNLSIIYQILKEHNMTGLLTRYCDEEKRKTDEKALPTPKSRAAAEEEITNEELLVAAIEQMEHELFSSRCLTFKITFFQLYVHAFFDFVHSEDRKTEQQYQECYQNGYAANRTASQRHCACLEYAFTSPLLKCLDRYSSSLSSIDRENSEDYVYLSLIANNMERWFEIILERVHETTDRVFHFLPHSPEWLVQEFGSKSCSEAKDKANYDAATQKYEELVAEFEEMTKKLEIASQLKEIGHKEALEEVKRNGKIWERKVKAEIKELPCIVMIAVFYSKNGKSYQRYSNILDYAISGSWGKCHGSSLAEWIIQMWGYHRYVGVSVPLTHLHVACLEQVMGAIPFLLCENEGRDIDAQCSEDGNTALHYAVLAQNQQLTQWLITYSYPDMELRNHKNQRPCDIVRTTWKTNSFAFAMYMERIWDSTLRESVLDVVQDSARVQKIDRLQMERSQRIEAERAVVSRKLKEEEKNHHPTARASLVYTEEQVKKANDAERELLAQEEAEKAANDSKKKQANNSRKKNNRRR